MHELLNALSLWHGGLECSNLQGRNVRYFMYDTEQQKGACMSIESSCMSMSPSASASRGSSDPYRELVSVCCGLLG